MNSNHDTTNAAPAADPSVTPAATPARTAAPAVWQSEDLFHGQREIVIQHGDLIYRLRRTRQGKLILHK